MNKKIYHKRKQHKSYKFKHVDLALLTEHSNLKKKDLTDDLVCSNIYIVHRDNHSYIFHPHSSNPPMMEDQCLVLSHL